MASFSRGLRCSIGVAMLAGGMGTLESRAEPYWETAVNGAAAGDSWHHDDHSLLRHENALDIGARHWSGLGELLSDSVAFGNVSGRFELGYGHGAVLFAGEDDAAGSFSLIGIRQARAAAAQSPGQDSMGEDLLRSLRDALLEQADGANFSFAGIEFNVKGRSVTVNGHDVVPVLQNVQNAMQEVSSADGPVELVPVSTSLRARGDATTTAFLFEEVAFFATNPITLFLSAALALGYLFVRAWAKIQDMTGRTRDLSPRSRDLSPRSLALSPRSLDVSPRRRKRRRSGSR